MIEICQKVTPSCYKSKIRLLLSHCSSVATHTVSWKIALGVTDVWALIDWKSLSFRLRGADLRCVFIHSFPPLTSLFHLRLSALHLISLKWKGGTESVFFLFEPWDFCPLQPTIDWMPSGRTAFQLLPFLLPLRCTFQFYSSLPALPLIPSEPSDVPHVTQLLEWLPAETALLGFAPVAVDGAMAHHLRHCPYHFRLFKTELVSSQELPESHYGQPLQSLKILGAASSSSLSS